MQRSKLRQFQLNRYPPIEVEIHAPATTLTDQDTAAVADHLGCDFTTCSRCKLVGNDTYLRVEEVGMGTLIDCHTHLRWPGDRAAKGRSSVGEDLDQLRHGWRPGKPGGRAVEPARQADVVARLREGVFPID